MPELLLTNIGFEISVLLISILAGAVGSILGLGGGIIVVPALTLGFGVPIRYAIAASLVSVIATSCGAAATYVRDRIANIRVGMFLEIATTLGAVAAATSAPRIPPRFLFGLFALIMVYSIVIMLRRQGRDLLPVEQSSPWAKTLRLSSSYPEGTVGRDTAYGVTGVWSGFMLMFGAGMISALLGIGSGSLKVPAMDAAMRLPIKVSTATSNFMIGVTGAAGAGAYFVRGDIVPELAAPVALGVLLGAGGGSLLLQKLSSLWIRRGFVLVLGLVALQMAGKMLNGEVR